MNNVDTIITTLLRSKNTVFSVQLILRLPFYGFPFPAFLLYVQGMEIMMRQKDPQKTGSFQRSIPMLISDLRGVEHPITAILLRLVY